MITASSLHPILLLLAFFLTKKKAEKEGRCSNAACLRSALRCRQAQRGAGRCPQADR